MENSTLERLYAATNDGLDIICAYYPEARACADDKRKKFRMRPEERTPSASIYLDNKTTPRCWRVTDFGGDGKALRPIEVVMQEERLDFSHALAAACRRFAVQDSRRSNAGRAEAEWRPSLPGETEGYKELKFLKAIPQEHLKLLGPLVKQEHCDQLGWQEVETLLQVVKGGKTKIEKSTSDFPILARRCRVEATDGGEPLEFFKIYQPLAGDKAFRFFYHPQGVKPPRYINGLAELKAAYRKYSSEQEAEWKRDVANENRPYVEHKLGEAVFCSGERDALCVRSCGFWPLWLNSETADVSEKEMREIKKYVDHVYNIPDIDDTGIRRGRAFALKHLDVLTVWLPESLRRTYDHRGGRCKDLRDWMGLNPKIKEFKRMLDVAMPARFYYKTKEGERGREKYELDAACVNYFLSLHGYGILYDRDADSSQFVRNNNGVIERIRARDTRKFLLRWVEEQKLPREVTNLLLASRKVSDAAMENLREINPDFTSFDEKTQWFFFQNGSVKVTGNSIDFYKRGTSAGDAACAVWEDNVVAHDFRKLPPMFEITSEEENGKTTWKVNVLDTTSPFFGYLINTSRIYWRKELEEQFPDKKSAEEYAASHKFCIDGDNLTARETREQMQNLCNKMFVIGYMLHRFKSPSRAWAPYAMDSRLGEEGECNGRSGKSFFFKTLSIFLRTVTLSGRNPKLMDNPHVYDQVTRHTQMLQVDDCNYDLSTRQFFDNITSDMNVNPKNQQSYTIKFEESPKLCFSTNYVPKEFDASTDARMLYMVFSDYYHQRTDESDYFENRTIRDDFGRDLFSNTYPEELWNADLNFFMQCEQFYLGIAGKGQKILPPMEAILQRRLKATIGALFEDWAEVYFSRQAGTLDTLIFKQQAYEDFLRATGAKITPNTFKKKLKAYCAFSPRIATLNPEYLCNDKGRILQKNSEGKTVEMIYLETPEGEREHHNNLAKEIEKKKQEQEDDLGKFIL